MIFDNPNWLIFYSGLGLIVVELILGVDTGFDFLLVGISLILGALAGFLFDNYLVAVILATIISVLYIVFGRKYLKEKLHIPSRKTNIDALIGQSGVIVRTTGKEKAGQVKVENEVWRAVSDKLLKPGAKVKVISVEGVTLKVA